MISRYKALSSDLESH